VTEPDGRQLSRLLRASRERPAGHRTAEQRDEFSPQSRVGTSHCGISQHFCNALTPVLVGGIVRVNRDTQAGLPRAGSRAYAWKNQKSPGR
jgi:hypothetical protein